MDILSPLADTRFARLFAAQVMALLGTGLLTIALALLAVDIAGARGGLVLGFALTLKMIAYVGLAPVANALFGGLPRRELLVALNLIRACVALILPFVTEIWQIYALIFVLQSASAAFTPTFQATIPDILPDEATYTRALSLSRLAQDTENLASPALAAALLTLMPATGLFFGTAAGMVGSAALVWLANPPRPAERRQGQHLAAHLFGHSGFILPRRGCAGLLALNMAAAAGGAMVIVNTAVIVDTLFARGKSDVALAMTAFGLGSVAAALALPRLLDHLPDRPVMLTGAAGLSATLIFGAVLLALAPAFGAELWPGYLIWMVLAGLFYSVILTPTGRLLRRSADAAERPALFAAQFALSHACWLIAYPLAGMLGVWAGMTTASVLLGLLAAGTALAARRLWPGPAAA